MRFEYFYNHIFYNIKVEYLNLQIDYQILGTSRLTIFFLTFIKYLHLKVYYPQFGFTQKYIIYICYNL